MADHYDVVVLGGGPGGYAAALYGAAAGLDIAMIEEARVGGTCLHKGCIPAKELLQTAEVLRTVRDAKEFGVDAGQPTLDLATSLARKQQVIDRLTKGLETLLKGRKVTVVPGTGTVVDADSTPGTGLGRHRAHGRRADPRHGVVAAFDPGLRLRRDADPVLGPRPRHGPGARSDRDHRWRRDRLRVRVVPRRRRQRGHRARGDAEHPSGRRPAGRAGGGTGVQEAQHHGGDRRDDHRLRRRRSGTRAARAPR